MNQEQIMQIQMLEQEANQFNQQLQIIEQNVIEMQELETSLLELDSGENKEILANIGKRIYLPVEIKDKKPKLIVEVGKGNFVEKSISDTITIIKNQIERLAEARTEVSERIEQLQQEMIHLMGQIEKEQSKSDKK